METSSFLDSPIDTTISVFARNAQLMRHAGSSMQIDIHDILLPPKRGRICSASRRLNLSPTSRGSGRELLQRFRCLVRIHAAHDRAHRLMALSFLYSATYRQDRRSRSHRRARLCHAISSQRDAGASYLGAARNCPLMPNSSHLSRTTTTRWWICGYVRQMLRHAPMRLR
jgi:hypothetical protein